MKVKELIEELQKFNPDGVVTVSTFTKNGMNLNENCGKCRITGVSDSADGEINPIIVALM